LEKIEYLIGCRLPEDYVEFLLEQRGGFVPEANGFLVLTDQEAQEAFGDGFLLHELLPPKKPTRPDLELLETIRDYAGRLREGTIPIACSGMGDLVLLGVEPPIRGKVYVWDHEREGIGIKEPTWNSYCVAESFTQFIESLQTAPPL
jgi:hypothetical protein